MKIFPEFVPQPENVRRWQEKPVDVWPEGDESQKCRYHSASAAAKALGLSKDSITQVCRWVSFTAGKRKLGTPYLAAYV